MNRIANESDRRRRTQNVLAVVSAIAGTILVGAPARVIAVLHGYAEREIEVDPFFGRQRQLLTLLGLALLSFVTLVVILRYLRGDLRLPFLFRGTETESHRVGNDTGIGRDEFDALRMRLERLAEQSVGIEPNRSAAMLDSIKVETIKHLETSLPSELKAQLAQRGVQEERAQQIRKIVSDGRMRLERELAALSRRGNLNLAIGSITTGIAVYLLYSTVSGTAQAFTNIPGLLSFYLPRVSVAIFVEVFSFFFLRLYRSGLSDVKHYHGELLTLDFRTVALEAALTGAKHETIASVLKTLSQTDRNRISNGASRAPRGGSLDPKLVLNFVESALKVVGEGKKQQLDGK